jgi:DNA-binding transcriptional LysR family regulator
VPAAVSAPDAGPFLRSGQLEVLLNEDALLPADIRAAYPQRQNLAAKLRVFVEFLTAHFAPGAAAKRIQW